MKMAELSRTTGVPVPTIKFYLREGLLPPGQRTSRNQAEYDDSHVRRLTLIRTLVDVARLPLSTIGEILAQLDAAEPQLHRAFGLAQRGITEQLAASDPEHRERATAVVDELLERRGWRVVQDNPARQGLASVLAAYFALGATDLTDDIDRYAEAAESIAEVDIGAIARRGDPSRQLEGVVIGTLLGDALFASLRRIAHEEFSARAFLPAATESGSPPDGDGRA